MRQLYRSSKAILFMKDSDLQDTVKHESSQELPYSWWKPITIETLYLRWALRGDSLQIGVREVSILIFVLEGITT